MHIGQLNQGADFSIQPTDNERDFGVEIRRDLKALNLVCKVAFAVDRVFGILKNKFLSRDAVLWIILYTTYVRPDLEYGVHVWIPHAKKGIKTQEKVPHSLK